MTKAQRVFLDASIGQAVGLLLTLLAHGWKMWFGIAFFALCCVARHLSLKAITLEGSEE